MIPRRYDFAIFRLSCRERLAGGGRAPVRVGRRQIAGWFAPEVARQLHMMALEEDTTLQALMAEAFNDVFTKRGKPPIA
jgi:hypothetical protein